jgi:hypothetical protein
VSGVERVKRGATEGLIAGPSTKKTRGPDLETLGATLESHHTAAAIGKAALLVAGAIKELGGKVDRLVGLVEAGASIGVPQAPKTDGKARAASKAREELGEETEDGSTESSEDEEGDEQAVDDVVDVDMEGGSGEVEAGAST